MFHGSRLQVYQDLGFALDLQIEILKVKRELLNATGSKLHLFLLDGLQNFDDYFFLPFHVDGCVHLAVLASTEPLSK